jgi:hypothetical protein
VERPGSFFRGSELPRLSILAAIMVGGWVLAWQYIQQRPEPAEAPLVVSGQPEPVVPDRSPEFEGVTDRTPISLRDNAAISLLLGRAREKSAKNLAAASRRDIALPHLWETPERYRGVPVHLLGSARQVLRYPSKLAPRGWLYEAWIFTPEAARVPYVCMFEDAPEGFPIGTGISERVVFNGYFLKVMKYQAGDVPRGAPVLIGRIGWAPHEASPAPGKNSTFLHWSLAVIAVLFLISLSRWIYQLRGLFPRASSSPVFLSQSTHEELEPSQLDAWVQSLAGEDDGGPAPAHEPEPETDDR